MLKCEVLYTEYDEHGKPIRSATETIKVKNRAEAWRYIDITARTFLGESCEATLLSVKEEK